MIPLEEGIVDPLDLLLSHFKRYKILVRIGPSAEKFIESRRRDEFEYIQHIINRHIDKKR